MTFDDLQPLTESLTVLLADDEEIIRKSFGTLLRFLFKEVDIAEDGLEAFRLVKKNPHKYDIILTDVNMPYLDGLGLIKKLRADSIKIPILVVSGHTESERLFVLLNAGVDGFIAKPVEEEQLVHSLYKLAHHAKQNLAIEKYKKELEESNAELLALTDKLIEKNIDLDRLVQAFNAKISLSAHQANSLKQETLKKEEIVEDDYFGTLLGDDLHELRELLYEIEQNTYLLATKQKEEGLPLLKTLGSRFQKFALVLNHYPLFLDMAQSIKTFGDSVIAEGEAFYERHAMTLALIEGFVFVLDKYLKEIWMTPSKNPNFYDASIKNDVAMVLMLLIGKKTH